MKTTGNLATLGLLLCWGCGPAISPDVRYIAFGDSITGTQETDTYPRFLVAQLGISHSEFAAEGSGGRTVAGGLQRLREIVAFDLYPNNEVLIYFLGGADVINFVGSFDPSLTAAPSDSDYPFSDQLVALLDPMRSTMRDTLQLAIAQGFEVFTATYFPLPAGVAPCDPLGGSALDDVAAARVNEYLDLLNDLITELSGELSVTLVDLNQADSPLHQDGANFADCTHPSEAGAEIIANHFADALR